MVGKTTSSDLRPDRLIANLTKPKETGMTQQDITAAIVALNREYLDLHTQKERLFWETKMGISKEYENFNKAEGRLVAFKNDITRLNACREMLAAPEADDAQKETLRGWVHFFEANVIEQPEARALGEAIVEMESKLALARGSMNLGYTDPATGAFVAASSVELSLKVASAPDEKLREACFHGLESIEDYVIDKGFFEIVKARNKLAHMLGYEDYYDYKVSTTEGFGKRQLFTLLDDLAARTEAAQQRYIDQVRAEHGESALTPWSFRYITQGDAVRDLDPYMQFEDALQRWGKSFAALGISYEQAVLQLDLVVRKGKYENGFCHAPVVPFKDAQGRVRSEVNFTSNAVPGQVGSGKRAAETLFHEGGHAAHFANMLMGAPCFSQEFAPTSAAFAETQSMFCDSLLDDADWLTRYAKDKDGNPVPWTVIENATRKSQPAQVSFIRSLLMVCYAEKALYEMADDELTRDNVLKTFVNIERRLGLLSRCPRPTLAVPHLLSGEASCIYHGYVLALAGVALTRHFFTERDGYLTDNPKIGPTLREVYWKPGNSITFVDYLARLTGSPFTMDALVTDLSMSADEAVAEQKARVAKLADVPAYSGPVELDCTLRMVHGADVIASTENGSFEDVARTYADWLKSLNPGASV
jgi:hypothetical protein